MSKKTIVCLNAGSQTVSLAVFELHQNSLLLQKYVTKSITANVDNEALRSSQTKVAIENIVEELGIKKAKVYCAIANSYGFTKFLKLIQIPQEDLAKIVSYEAKQNIPMALSEVNWGWHHLQSYEQIDEVELVAVRKESLSELMQALSNSALVTQSLQLSNTALINSYYHAYADRDVPTLLLDLGATSTSLIYHQGASHFCRVLTVGGVAITEEICQALDVDFDNAESLKTVGGKLLLDQQDKTDGEDGVTKSPANLITTHYKRIVSEIQRTLEYLEREYEWAPPQRILLAGGGASLPNAEEFFTKYCEVQATLFDPLKNVRLSDRYCKSVVQRRNHEMGALVGLALFGGGVAQISTEIVPDTIQERRENKQKAPLYVTAFALLILSLFVWSGAQYYASHQAQERLAQLQSEVAVLEPSRQAIQELDQKREALDVIAVDYITAISSRYRVVNGLRQLSEAFRKEGVWIDQITELIDYQLGQEAPLSPVLSLARESSASSDAETGPFINAVEIRGYWRDTQDQAGVLKDLMKQLLQEGGEFGLTLNGKAVALADLLKTSETIAEGEIKAPFIMILPLKAPVPLD